MQNLRLQILTDEREMIVAAKTAKTLEKLINGKVHNIAELQIKIDSNQPDTRQQIEQYEQALHKLQRQQSVAKVNAARYRMQLLQRKAQLSETRLSMKDQQLLLRGLKLKRLCRYIVTFNVIGLYRLAFAQEMQT